MLLKLKLLILLTFFAFKTYALGANPVFSEVFLKKSTQRIERLLRESLEAEVFLDEDLSGALDLMEKAQIKWAYTLNLRPTLYLDSSRPVITLSSELSFKATLQQKIVITLEILFHLKRQMEGSLLPIPQTRIELFSKKFSPLLLEDIDSCSVSISPLSPVLNTELREEFVPELLSKLGEKDYAYDSTWGNNIIYVDVRESTDAKCGGKNRNILNLKVYLVNILENTTLLIADEEATSCGYSTSHKQKVIRKITRKLKKQLPKCQRAFGQP